MAPSSGRAGGRRLQMEQFSGWFTLWGVDANAHWLIMNLMLPVLDSNRNLIFSPRPYDHAFFKQFGPGCLVAEYHLIHGGEFLGK